MLVDITQETKIGKIYRTGSPALNVKEIICNEGTKSEYKTIEYSIATHNMGTHIDVMGVGVEIPLERLIGNGIKYDVSHITDRPVEVKDIDLSLIEGGEFIFFQTNWDRYLMEDKYADHPEISIDLAKKLSELDINMVGIDALGIGRGKNHGTIDKLLGKAKKYAIENLCNLDKIPAKGFKVYCLPTKIEGLDALPARILVEF
ncbi:cyclase family protein [Psychrilyobacter atlanticus]|uniref:cyclase family protein n=1 Tax=Psychrilyobacter atlanticus TaxID=271091 RepID=UPI0004246235|nr:cyclase family protein [Psychrilyobacter atlanticus]